MSGLRLKVPSPVLGTTPLPVSLPDPGVAGWTGRWAPARSSASAGDVIAQIPDAITNGGTPLTRFVTDVDAGVNEPTLQQTAGGLRYARMSGIGFQAAGKVFPKASTMAAVFRYNGTGSVVRLNGSIFGRSTGSPKLQTGAGSTRIVDTQATTTGSLADVSGWVLVVGSIEELAPYTSFGATDIAGAAWTQPTVENQLYNSWVVSRGSGAVNSKVGEFMDQIIWPFTLTAAQRKTVQQNLRAAYAEVLLPLPA